jgi:hypothetical protein
MQRCLTVVVLLSDRSAYGGGHFEARLGGRGGKPAKIPIEGGDAIVFLSKHLWHRVSKVSGSAHRVPLLASPCYWPPCSRPLATGRLPRLTTLCLPLDHNQCTHGLRQSLVFWVRRRGAAPEARFMPQDSDGSDREEAASPS